MIESVLLYAAALLLGLVAALLVIPLDALEGAGLGWNPPAPDQAQALTGHLAFQADTWRWPLLQTARLFVPHGISLALVDSNPLVSVAAKAWVRLTGSAPVNWLGWFLGACWALQPVGAVYAARGLRVGWPAALTAGVLACAWPALMFRMVHINLCAHVLILVALGMAFRRVERPGNWFAPALRPIVAILTHPYLFELCAAVLAAVPLQAVLRRRPGWRWDAVWYGLSGVAAVAVLLLVAGPLGGGDKGFTFFSMNLASPVWPQMSGVFGPGLPILDATGGQYEGFNWLGAGTMLLGLAAIVAAALRRSWPRPALGLVLVLAALAVMSLSSRVYAGPVKLLDLGNKPWEDIFGSFRSAGRAFWPVGYALMLGAVACIDRLSRAPRTRWLAPALLPAAAVLQIIDIGPLLHRARSAWTNGAGIQAPAVPAGVTLFTVAPHPGCTPDLPTKWSAPVMLLDAVRHGAETGDIGLGRSPPWFSCEAIAADALELPLLPHEVRAFSGASIQAPLRPVLLGPGAVCKHLLPGPPSSVPGAPPFGAPDLVLCGRDVADFPGDPLPPGVRRPPVALPFAAGPDALGAVLGYGWRLGAGGAWSEGPHSTIVIPVTPGPRLELRLRAAGVATKAGSPRVVTVTAGRQPVGQFTLPDGLETEVTIAIPASTTESGFLRVALDVVRPVDPARRGLPAPVHRAAIRLGSLSLRPE